MSFIPKKKEPLLSSQTEDILLRSKDKDYSPDATLNQYDVIRYKSRIKNILCDNDDLLRALHHPDYSKAEILNGDLFKDTVVFDWMKAPEYKTSIYNYVCFDVSIRTTASSLSTTRIVFRVISHEDDMKTDWGVNRTDLLGLIISEEFDWANELGMSLVKVSDDAYATNDKYHYREIVYQATNPNNLYQKINGLK